MVLDEFDLIHRYFSRPTSTTVLGVGDDAALVAPAAGMQLAISADMLVEGRHFFPGADPYSLGWKSLAVNLSDMAAMGAIPRWFTLCISLPSADADWLDGFSRGLFALAEQYGVELIGGDTTAGPLTISIQIIGQVETGRALCRHGAQAGDDIWLSGPTGAAALAVQHRYGNLGLDAEDLVYCTVRLDRPEPRIALGRGLLELATAAIDISDGLVADVGHLAGRSGLAAHLYRATLALPALSDKALALPVFESCLLAGGDDYELCFTASPSCRSRLMSLGEALCLPLARVGTMLVGQGVDVLDDQGNPLSLARAGFNHFA
ncbi:thiamine-phosphate kinase [Chitinimonas sp. BJB300]|uniref:thiamine-phosphate kinase n=1 Tax=Chitinimonas sp. BJB300 TaxID=1559339 RepID=UPI000C10615E|nr:thiamine-phosphate kinase [Chitinimonas sp. BJB300]PHV09975.1 thiamine-phosphate kinase [Chitinimonas sp. BJB300]TSJ87184.1 thiamine-phosphate kinase [Chitinimonas sp. BJB300]